MRIWPDIIDIAERLAADIPEDAVWSLLDHLEDVQRSRLKPDDIGWDLRRLFGDDGYGMYELAVAAFGGAHDGPHMDARWASFARERVASDRLLIDLMDGERDEGWQPPPEIVDALDWLMDSAAANRQKLSLTKESPAMSVVPFPTPPAPVPAAPLPKLIQSSAQFVAGFVPPEYLLDGILQRLFCYALTAATGAGKTAFALLLAMCVALGRRLADRDVERGAVLYFASENSVDVQARWVAMAQHYKFDVDTIDVHFVSGATKLSEITERITAEAQAIGDLALVIVDTSAATFEGEDENSNVHVMEHAKRMRSLTAAMAAQLCFCFRRSRISGRTGSMMAVAPVRHGALPFAARVVWALAQSFVRRFASIRISAT
jgi:hypothetical protein